MTSFPYDSFSQPGVLQIQYVEVTPESALAFLEAVMSFKVQNAEICPKTFPGPVQP